MMHGTPVIAHKSGGPLETIIDGKTGFLYENESDLTACLEKIINLNNEQYAEMQKASQVQAKEFDISKSVARLEETLSEVLKK